MSTESKKAPAEPGDGIRSSKTTGVFRAVNFELFAKPVSNVLQENFNFFFFVEQVSDDNRDSMYHVLSGLLVLPEPSAQSFIK